MKKLSTYKKQLNIQSINKMNRCLTKAMDKQIKKSKSQEDLNIHYLPFFCPITKKIRDNETIRDILIYNSSNQIKPRFSWYNPDEGMIPKNWFEEGIKSDLSYYYNCD